MATATKYQLAEQVLRIIAGGHKKPDNPIDIREIMLHADQLRDEYIREDCKPDPITGVITVDPSYVSYYTASVQSDESRSLRYIDLPANPISLPMNQGIYSISPLGSPENQFIPIHPLGSWMYSGTMADANTLITKYWNENSVVFFKNLNIAISNVLVGLVASSKDILETEPYPISPDAEAVIIRRLLQIFATEQQAPHDETENGQKNG